MALRRLKNIDAESKYTVGGYIREQHTKLFSKNRYALFENIPISISSICTLYYHLFDYFELLDDDMISVSSDKKTITKKCDGWGNSSYGSITIPSTNDSVCKWFVEVGTTGKCIIGLASKPFLTNFNFNRIDRNKNYCYGVTTGRIKHHNGHWESYDKIIGCGDILCIELNLKKRYIKFYEKENDSGRIAFKNVEIGEDINYRLAVSSHIKSSQIKIVKFTQSK